MKMDVANEWLKAAKLDLETARYLVKVEHLTPVVAFHAQQAIEKSFKAIIEDKQEKIPKKHDLLTLKNMIRDRIDIENEDLLDSLNSLYIDSRYPGDMGLLPHGQPTLEDAREFYEFALDVFREAIVVVENKK